MKYVLIIGMIYLTGCGVAQDLGRGCSGDTKAVCQTIFGSYDKEIEYVQTTDSEAINALQDQIDQLSYDNDLLVSTIAELSKEIDESDDKIELLRSLIARNEEAIEELQEQIKDLDKKKDKKDNKHRGGRHERRH